jgi:hypothetical protein
VSSGGDERWGEMEEGAGGWWALGFRPTSPGGGDAGAQGRGEGA